MGFSRNYIAEIDFYVKMNTVHVNTNIEAWKKYVKNVLQKIGNEKKFDRSFSLQNIEHKNSKLRFYIVTDGNEEELSKKINKHIYGCYCIVGYSDRILINNIFHQNRKCAIIVVENMTKGPYSNELQLCDIILKTSGILLFIIGIGVITYLLYVSKHKF